MLKEETEMLSTRQSGSFPLQEPLGNFMGPLVCIFTAVIFPKRPFIRTFVGPNQVCSGSRVGTDWLRLETNVMPSEVIETRNFFKRSIILALG